MEEKTKDTEKVLADEILTDVKRQAAETIEKAQAEAKATVEQAVRDAETARGAAIREVEQRVARAGEIAEASLAHLQRRQRLDAQGKLVAEAFDQALERLRSKQGFDYRRVLSDLAVEAVGALPGDAFVMALNPADAKDFGAALAGDVVEAVRAKSGRAVTVKAIDRPGLSDGGVVVESADGAQRVDNSFAGRLRRLESELRFEVADVLFGKEK